MPKRLVTRLTDRRGPDAAGRHAGLKAALALGIVALGVAVFLEPTIVARPSVRAIGTIMLAAGLFQVALAMTARRHDPLARGLAIGVVNTGVGALFVADPQLGITTLSLVLGLAQIVVGVDRGLGAWRDRGGHWPWVVALGALLVASGTSILLGWPASGLTAIGRFVGLNVVVEGVTWLVILRRARERARVSVTLAPSAASAEPVPHDRP